MTNIEAINWNKIEDEKDLEYCKWNKDMFFGSLPDAQYGDTSVVDISYGTTGAPVKTAQNLMIFLLPFPFPIVSL